MIVEDRLTDEKFWISEDKDSVEFRKHDPSHSIITFINKYLPVNTCGKCLEIGSFPGPFSAAIGDLGYSLSGIDFHPANSDQLPAWLKLKGYKVDKFQTADFFDVQPEPIYDVVCSFGFIEHFKDYENVISMHIKYLRPGGFLIITTPNFKGTIQQNLHIFFDNNNLSHHNLESMNPAAWAQISSSKGMKILYKGFFGGFWFWHGHEPLGFAKKKLLWIVERAIPRLRKILPQNSKAIAAYCGIIAQIPL